MDDTRIYSILKMLQDKESIVFDDDMNSEDYEILLDLGYLSKQIIRDGMKKTSTTYENILKPKYRITGKGHAFLSEFQSKRLDEYEKKESLKQLKSSNKLSLWVIIVAIITAAIMVIQIII